MKLRRLAAAGAATALLAGCAIGPTVRPTPTPTVTKVATPAACTAALDQWAALVGLLTEQIQLDDEPFTSQTLPRQLRLTREVQNTVEPLRKATAECRATATVSQ
jgi:hypothetical protein